jgi:hypothetical protein
MTNDELRISLSTVAAFGHYAEVGSLCYFKKYLVIERDGLIQKKY